MGKKVIVENGQYKVHDFMKTELSAVNQEFADWTQEFMGHLNGVGMVVDGKLQYELSSEAKDYFKEQVYDIASKARRYIMAINDKGMMTSESAELVFGDDKMREGYLAYQKMNYLKEQGAALMVPGAYDMICKRMGEQYASETSFRSDLERIAENKLLKKDPYHRPHHQDIDDEINRMKKNRTFANLAQNLIQNTMDHFAEIFDEQQRNFEYMAGDEYTDPRNEKELRTKVEAEKEIDMELFSASADFETEIQERLNDEARKETEIKEKRALEEQLGTKDMVEELHKMLTDSESVFSRDTKYYTEMKGALEDVQKALESKDLDEAAKKIANVKKKAQAYLKHAEKEGFGKRRDKRSIAALAIQNLPDDLTDKQKLSDSLLAHDSFKLHAKQRLTEYKDSLKKQKQASAPQR